MSIIYMNLKGSLSAGGPNIFCYKFANAMSKIGHKIIYDDPNKSDVALCIINTGKILKKVNINKTKVILRIDGIYNKIYNEKFNRPVEEHMIALHRELARDIPLITHTVFQSTWSRDKIFDEIIKIDDNNKYSIINNGVDINLFKPLQKKIDNFINLLHIGKMRNGYLMESLIGTYEELRGKGNKIRLILAGNMDNECLLVYNKYKHDKNIIYLGSFSNNSLPQIYAKGDIFLAPRQGSSNDNVIVESLASGCPVVIPSFGGNSDFITNKQQGIIVKSNNWDYGPEYNNKLADGVEEIMEDLDNFKQRAREHAVKNLSLDSMVNKYLKAMGL